MKKLYILLLVILSPIILLGKNIYVSIQGNDSNNGSLEFPFKTIERAIKELNKNNENTIYLREGEYQLNNSIELQNLKNLSILAFQNEKVRITGCIKINKDSIKKPKGNIIKQFNKKTRTKIRYIDCNHLGIKLSGLIKKGFGHNSGPSWNELFINDTPLNVAKWPNNGMILIDSVINTGNIISKNIKNKGHAIFKYNSHQPNLWKSIKDAWIGGYFGEGWGDELLPIKSIDTKRKTISIEGSSIYGFKSGKNYLRWYACNILEELDIPNEYYIDKTNNFIYFYPSKNKIEKIQLSNLTAPIISIKSCNKIAIKNIIIECTRGIGILVENSSNIVIDNCIIRNIGHIGIKITGKSYNNKIQNSKIYHIGSNGIILDGGNRKQLIPGNNIVRNCLIYNFSRIEHSYKPAIAISGCGNKIINVEMYDAPSMAIMLNGNNHTIKYVNIHHVCKEVHDQGAFYYGRNPSERGNQILYSYFHDIQSPFIVRAIYHDDGACGMIVHGCIFNNISSTPVQIGGGQDITYTNNIFMNLPSAITIDARLKTWANKWLKPGGEYDKKFKAVNYNQPPFSEAFPELLNYWNDDPTTPKRNVFSNNIFYNVIKLVEGDVKYLKWNKNWNTKDNPGFKNVKKPLEGINYRIIKQHLPEFHEIPLDSIGCHL